MHDIYFWTTPNGYKILIFAEEAGIPYTLKPVNIGKGEQFDREFLEISPNNRIPALVDHAPLSGKGPISIFESGAILLYLADKTQKFIPADLAGRAEVMQWLVWQVANLGPICGQNRHFLQVAPEKLAYPIQRFGNEVNRLYGVLDKLLAEREFMAGAYSIADMAAWPWVNPEADRQDPAEFPNLMRWKAAIAERPALLRAYEIGRKINTRPPANTEEANKILYGQTAAVVRR